MMAPKKRKSSGQVLTEYVIMLVLFALLAIVTLMLVRSFSLYGGRLVDMVSIEYP